ncbi:MAG: hypothetical protein GKR87_04050 [Kiritimatiellae bacterium]|nr:hypothetical protein [Kiritimatiellia bacterium]
MNTTVKSALIGLDVPANRIHMESYGETVKVRDIGKDTLIRDDRLWINATLFLSGRGMFCRAQLVEGKVHMHARMALEDEDIKRGIILTCQSIPTTEKLAFVFDP